MFKHGLALALLLLAAIAANAQDAKPAAAKAADAVARAREAAAAAQAEAEKARAAAAAIDARKAAAAKGEKQAKEGKSIPLFDGKTLDGWKKTDFAGAGDVKVEKGQVVVEMGDTLSGITWKDANKLPKDNYEITLQAMKLKGDDFFCGLTFPIRDSHASLILGGWGGTLVGISSLDGQDASENETTIYRKFEHNKWYKVRLRVADGKLQAWVNDEQVIDVELKDKKISTRIEVDPSRPLGIATYQVSAAFKDVQLVRLK